MLDYERGDHCASAPENSPAVSRLEGLEAVRGSGQTNMLDLPKVQTIATRLGYLETVLWLEEHQREYTEGLFQGFIADK